MLILIVAGGPEKGRTYELLDDHPPVTLGREGDPVALSDRKASRRHARLWRQGAGWYVKDLGSRHGTYLNQRLVDGPTEVRDGDYLQIGSSVFVAARMPVEHAERLALIGEAPPPQPAGGARPGARGGKWIAGGLAAAAAIALLANAGLFLASSHQNHQIRRQLALLNKPRARGASDDGRYRRVLAELEKQNGRDQTLHDQLARLTRDARKSPARIREKLDAVLARLQDQPDVAGKVDALSKDNRQQLASLRQALAHQARASAKTDQSLAAVTDGIDHVLGTLESGRASTRNVQALAADVRDQLAKAGPAITRLTRKFDAAAKARDAARQQGREDTDQVLAAIRGVKTALPAHPDALAQVAQSNQILLQTVLAKLEDNRAQRKVLAAIADVKSALPSDQSAKLDKVLARLKATPASGITQKQVAAAVTRAIEPLADVVAGADKPRDAKLDRVLAAVRQRDQTDKKLASLYDTLKSQPQRTRQMLDKALASLGPGHAGGGGHGGNESGGESRATRVALRRVLAEIRGKMITDSDRIALMVRHSVAKALDHRLPPPGSAPGSAPGSHPTGQAGDALAKADAAAAADGADADRSRSKRVADGDKATGSSDADADAADASGAGDKPLTEREQAYRMAFRTGQPVTVGAGRFNPVTGKVSDGRMLDPAAAKAAGIKHWRDWYNMDNSAERTRLQKLAQSYRAKRGQGPPVVHMPGQRDDGSVQHAALPTPSFDVRIDADEPAK